ncbi:MAG TPA: NfeD family protein [Gaiellaceae bacterium]|nr:NfeD family protein [Gaiellaceae bacterium]
MVFLISILIAVFVVPQEWAIPVVLLGGLVEVAEALLVVHYSRRRRAVVGAETMIGRRARVDTPCLPTGQVLLDGERWAARCDGGAAAADTVIVRGLEDLTLIVERER